MQWGTVTVNGARVPSCTGIWVLVGLLIAAASFNCCNGQLTAADEGESVLPLQEQVKLLQKQLTALTMRRREDYQLIENNLKRYIRESAGELQDIDIRVELRDLRNELRKLEEHKLSNGKERITVDWLTQSIAELRKEVAEVQQISSESSRQTGTRGSLVHKELQTLRHEVQSLKLEVASVRSRQETVDVQIADLQAELVQSMEDLRKSYVNSDKASALPSTIDYIQPHADHSLRHQRHLREQINVVERLQRQIKNELRQLKTHQVEGRLKKLEVEQHRLSNLSREVANLDKIHSSVLELFEEIEHVQDTFGHNIPDIQREISKLEFNYAQLNSRQDLISEEGQNREKELEALAMRIGQLQVANATSAQVDGGHLETPASHGSKWPKDCSEVSQSADDQPTLNAPAGGDVPVKAQCDKDWTVIQRRFDGSVDFNRSWDEYATGFGDVGSEFWIGNEQLHSLTQDNCTKLKIEMVDIHDNFWLVNYGFFKVASRASGYRLLVSDYRGNASDALNYQNHMEFSAVDVDRDISSNHCAANYEGGWWFSHCQHANLNGRYNLGLSWFDSARNDWIAVKSSRMLVGKDHVCLSSNVLSETRQT